MRTLGVVVLVALLSACTGPPLRPSSVAERTPSPTTVTRDNPGGDAENPTDAALSRLLNEPVGHRTDKFRTLRPHFADTKNWKRVRLLGHPTRAAFRYGKDPAYGFAVIIYSPTEGNEAPHACLERHVRRGLSLAKAFDLEVDPLVREVHDHYRGPESVDWAAREREEAERRQQLAKRRAEAANQRKTLAEARKKAQDMRRRMLNRGRRGTTGKRQTVAGGRKSPGVGSAARSAARKLRRPPPYVLRMMRAMRRTERRTHHLAHRRAAKAASDAEAAALLDFDVFVRGEQGGPVHVMVVPGSAEHAGQPPPKPPPQRPARKPPTPEELFAAAWKRWEKRYGTAAMPVVRSAGQFQTLFDDDRYLGAAVAYQSWPGTCLVQGFAVKVGSDEDLARKVVQRWLDEMAPRLHWEEQLREKPEFKNR